MELLLLGPLSLSDSTDLNSNLQTAPGTVCGGKLEFLGGLPEGLCEVRLVGAELSRDEGEWKVLATASASQVRFPTSTSSWVSDTLWVR